MHFVFILFFERQRTKDWEGEPDTDTKWPFADLLTFARDDHGWGQNKAGGWSSLGISQVGGKDPTFEPSLLHPKIWIGKKLELGTKLQLQPRHFNMGC